MSNKAYTKLIQTWVLQMTTAAGSGHPTSCLSAVEIMIGLLLSGQFRADVRNLKAATNDRLVFSKGHAAPLLYSLLALFDVIEPAELMTLREATSRLEGHPMPYLDGVDAATGSLGQGIGVAVGLALGQKKLQNTARTFVLLGDSECAEGSVWESVACAAHYKLDNLVIIVDVNRLGQRGETMYGHDMENYAHKFASFGARVHVLDDGNDIDKVITVFQNITFDGGKPTVILAKTTKGHGVSFLADQLDWHGKTLNISQLQTALAEVGPVDTSLRIALTLPPASHGVRATINQLVSTMHNALSPRAAYGEALVEQSTNPRLLVLDAEVSNSTFANAIKTVQPDKFLEMYIAEQNMISVSVGLSKIGFIPSVSTFGAFLTRGFDQIRMAAYSDAHINLVGTHVGVSIGADGVSQMALEDMAMMRVIYNSVVLYPSDAFSTKILYNLLLDRKGINYLRLTRADLPVLYDDISRFVIGGSHTLRESQKDVITIFAAGITVHEALKAHLELVTLGINVRVIDMYSIKPIDTEALIKARVTSHYIVVEDHYTQGGLYSALLETGLVNRPISSLAISTLPHSGTPQQTLSAGGIDASAIVERVLTIQAHRTIV